MKQSPAPGEYLLKWRGDFIEVTLALPSPRKGRALLRTDIGDKFGMTTFAPDKMPFSRPFGSMVPSAVVAGSRIFGCISRMIDNR